MRQDISRRTRDELLVRLDTSFAELALVVESIATLKPAAPDADWGPFEIVCHLSAWHRYTAVRLREIAAGSSGEREVDADALNAGFVAERRGLSDGDVRAELYSSLQELREAVGLVPVAQFRAPIGLEESSLAWFLVPANSSEHSEEHIGALREAASGS